MKIKYLSKVLFFFSYFLFLSILIFPQTIVQAAQNWQKEDNLVNLYFFHSNTCSHCQEEEKLLKKLEENYSNLRIYRYEIHEESSKELLKIAIDTFQLKSYGTPLTIIGEEVYLGYNENSKLKLIQAIEYASKYAYQDKLGEQIGITDLPFTSIEKAPLTLEEFRQEYGNYILLGKIETKNLEPDMIATITGLLSGVNPIFLISIIMVIWVLKKQIPRKRDQVLLLGFYFGTNFFFTSASIFSNKFYTLALQVLLLLLFTWGLVKYSKNKKRQYILLNASIISSVAIQFLTQKYYHHYSNIFLSIQKIYLLEGWEQVRYYIHYFISMFLIQILILIFTTMFISKIVSKNS